MGANHSFVDPLVQNARAAEIKIIKWATVMKALNDGVQDIVPLLSTGAIFITYRYGSIRIVYLQHKLQLTLINLASPTTDRPCAHPKQTWTKTATLLPLARTWFSL